MERFNAETVRRGGVESCNRQWAIGNGERERFNAEALRRRVAEKQGG